MKAGYIILGTVAIILGICNGCGINLLNPFAAGAYAISFGFMALSEATRCSSSKEE